MDVETFTASDGYQWKYRHYPASTPSRGRVIYLHGIQSHGGWYEQSCERLRDSGLDVFFLDRRGSGLNEKARGDCPGFRRLLDDISEFVNAEREKDPTKKTAMVAVSWGGKLAVAFQKRHPGLIDALALLCPGLFAKVGVPFRQKLRIAFSRFIKPTRLFPIPLSEPDLFTENAERQQFLREDELSLREATARFLLESARLDIYLRRAPRHVTMPVLLMLAEHDRIIDNAKVRAYVEKFATPDRTIIEYLGAHHTLEFEPDPEKFLNDLKEWIHARCTL